MGHLFRPSPVPLDPLGVGGGRRRALSRWATGRRVSRRAGHDRGDPVVHRLDDEAGDRSPYAQPAHVGRGRLSALHQRPRGHDDHGPFLGAPVAPVRRRRPVATRIRRDSPPCGLSSRDGTLRLGIRRAGDGREAQGARRRRRLRPRPPRGRRAGRDGAGAPRLDHRRPGARGPRHARVGSGVRAGCGGGAGAVGRADRALAGGRGRASRSAGPHHPGGRGSGGRGARDGAPARSHAGRDPLSSPRGGRWRSGAAIAVVASSVLVLVTVGWAGHRAERALAQRVAAATAGYLALVAPPARGSAGYDLPRLLIATRALDGLPGVAAGRDATDRWLGDTRLLLQEAVVRVPELRLSLSALAPIARGTELMPGDSGASAPWRRVVEGSSRAAVAVRLAPGRWAELRSAPDAGEGWMAGWLALTLGLALIGPFCVALAAWGERAAQRPQRLRETVAAWGFLAPSALHLGVFSFAPMLCVLYLSVHRWTLSDSARPFVGLANVERMVTAPLRWVSRRNTVLYALYVPVSMGLSLGAALALRRQAWAARLARTVFFLPCVCSVVAMALVWQWLYQPDFGVINYFLSAVGLRPVDWLGNPRTALVAVMIVSVWVQFGYQMSVFLAGLQGVPQVYLDAAQVDGASAWQRFHRITLPLLRPVTLFVLVTGVIGAFPVFPYMYVLTDGGPLYC